MQRKEQDFCKKDYICFWCKVKKKNVILLRKIISALNSLKKMILVYMLKKKIQICY